MAKVSKVNNDRVKIPTPTDIQGLFSALQAAQDAFWHSNVQLIVKQTKGGRKYVRMTVKDSIKRVVFDGEYIEDTKGRVTFRYIGKGDNDA